MLQSKLLMIFFIKKKSIKGWIDDMRGRSAPSQKGYAEHWNQRRWKNIRTLSKTKVTRTRVT